MNDQPASSGRVIPNVQTDQNQPDMSSAGAPQDAASPHAAPQNADHLNADRLAMIDEMVREISLQNDPQEMITIFRKRTASLYGDDASISLSRRELEPPQYRITRDSRWKENINPWQQKDRLPLLEGGVLAELLYGDQPQIVSDVRIDKNDPAYEFLKDIRSLMAIPIYDGGTALNMVVRLSSVPNTFDHADLTDALCTTNLFGRATNNLLLAQKLQEAYAQIDHELKQVAKIQRSLLPAALPNIPGMDIAASYKTATRAGGDYYDFFDLGDGRWGVLIADVSGHGTPAAVVMAMLQTMLHAQCMECSCSADVLQIANKQLLKLTRRHKGTFVTAFYGVYDSTTRTMTYSCAGHNPPLLIDKNIKIHELDQAQHLPLAIQPVEQFPQSSITFQPGDTLLLYTDGITEAASSEGEMYGRDRLLSCVREDVPNAQHIIDCITNRLIGFTGSNIQEDDQTLVALRIVG